MPRLDFRALQVAADGTVAKVVSAAATLNACDILVEADAAGAAAPFAITLPKLGDAFYFPYTIYTPAAGHDVTVNAAEGSGVFQAVLTAAADKIVIIPTRNEWILLHDTTT